MRVQDLIEKLMTYNRNAEVKTIVNNYERSFTIMFGGSDGCTKSTCDNVSFVIDSDGEKS